VTKTRARLIQIFGILVTIFGLIGYWSNKPQPTHLSQGQLGLVGKTCQEDRAINFLVAGRDKLYVRDAGAEILDANGHVIGRKSAARSTVLGANTDTILFISVLCDDVTIIAIPRDVWLEQWITKINSMYYYKGADGLKNAVANIIGLPIDYYAIINLDIFEHLVDALGGVEVNVPYNMNYDDFAAGLNIHLKKGPQVLDGKKAADFVRFRHTGRGDFDRIDNVKRLAAAMLKKMKSLNLASATKIPAIITAVYKDVETNAELNILLELLKNINDLKIKESLTLQGELAEVTAFSGERISVLMLDPQQVERDVASAFGGKARDFTTAPDATLLITNRSGQTGLAEIYKQRLIKLGISETNIITKEASFDPGNSIILSNSANQDDAEYYSNLFGLQKQQIDHINSRTAGIELVLAEDATKTVLGQITKSGNN